MVSDGWEHTLLILYKWNLKTLIMMDLKDYNMYLEALPG